MPSDSRSPKSNAAKAARIKARKRRRRIRQAVLICGVLLTVALIGGCIVLLARLFNGDSAGSPAQSANTQSLPSETVTDVPVDQQRHASFSFMGVGDNLLHDTIFVYFEQDHGHRDFTELYEMTRPYIEEADLSYINFETVCAGDQFGLSGYPNFNGPTEMIDTLGSLGFDWFSISSNHSLDAMDAGLIYENQYIHEHFPDLSTTGAYVSEENSETPIVREINGIRVGLCGFTYGLNGYTLPEGEEWLVDVYRNEDGSINYDLMSRRLEALNAVSDVQIVAMHWGEEYHTEPTEEQKELAQWLNQHGVEVIIGTHPHVIEPVEFIETPEQTTLVYYSLGNFISAQDQSMCMVGGMAKFNLDYNFDTKKTAFQNVQFIPTVTWISSDLRQYRTTTIREYTNDMAATHYMSAMGENITKEWVQQFVSAVMGSPENIEIVLE